MAKVQFQVDGLDANTASIFNQDVTFDGNVEAGSISIDGTDISSIYATQQYVTNAVSGVTVDLSTAAGNGIDWNASTSVFDIDTTLVQTRVSGVSDTEIGYLDGVTSNIQTQLNAKMSSNGYASNSVNSNITLVSGNKYFVDTTAARTLTLSASPTLGDEILIFDSSNLAGTNNITINSNSGKINGTVQDLIIDANAAVVTLIFTGSSYGWKVL